MPSSAVVSCLETQWQSWYCQNAICHLYHGDRRGMDTYSLFTTNFNFICEIKSNKQTNKKVTFQASYSIKGGNTTLSSKMQQSTSTPLYPSIPTWIGPYSVWTCKIKGWTLMGRVRGVLGMSLGLIFIKCAQWCFISAECVTEWPLASNWRHMSKSPNIWVPLILPMVSWPKISLLMQL